MCGIVGLYCREQKRIDRALLQRMNDVQAHRGPDGTGLHVEAGLGLGHRRLAIIDLAAGKQPLYNEDGSVVVVFNGEIYNFASLRRELEQDGHHFATHSDTEVIVHGWESWGERCVERLRGMFAFALWDRNRETLFLARDRLGIKPLHYAWLADGTLAFASELKALLCHPGLTRKLNPRAIEFYFAYGYIPDPDAILAGVAKLPAAHTLLIQRGAREPQLREYWDVPFGPLLRIDEAEAREELYRRTREAVASHLVADVPLGAFLSGGVDSSAVVAGMAELSRAPVHTCSIAFAEAAYDESAYARMVAEHLGTRHAVEQVDQDDITLIDRLAAIYDEPYADNSSLATYRLCELTRRHVKVALSGDGGDENLAGYRHYAAQVMKARLRALLPDALRRPLFTALGRLYPKADWAPKFLRAKATFETLSLDQVDAIAYGAQLSPRAWRRRIYHPDFLRALDGFDAAEIFRRFAERAPARDPLSLSQYLDMKIYLPGDILTKVDRASMANSLEVRVPLLDHELVEWISRLPPALKLKGREGKYVFKKCLETRLPHEVLYRKKQGFDVPVARWFRGPLKSHTDRLLKDSPLFEQHLLDADFVRRMAAEHRAGVRDNGHMLWSIMLFDAFQRHVLAA
jgi:asparagine synthase (glutamine-hydrolysing)